MLSISHLIINIITRQIVMKKITKVVIVALLTYLLSQDIDNIISVIKCFFNKIFN
jgi:hypothetical protein